MKKHYSSKSIEQKRKFIFVTFWNMEKAEKILNELEQNGYRFVKSRFRYFFTFQTSAPKKVQYVFTYILPKDTGPFGDWQILLKSDEYRGNLIQQGYFDIFRITRENVNLQDFYMDRLMYTRRVLIQKTIIAAFMAFVGAYATLTGDYSVIGRLCTMFLFVGGLLALLSYIIGFCSTVQQKKNLIDKYKGKTENGSVSL
ncbi:MAG: DUF2812 domain-containing protein [Oscillospiraceae bacterium]|nr:DUF2812 domain-containing protein [Oscillospiraceae bacterium]